MLSRQTTQQLTDVASRRHGQRSVKFRSAKRAIFIAGTLITVVTFTGCGPILTASTDTPPIVGNTNTTVHVSPPPGSSDADTSNPVVVTATQGHLATVIITDGTEPVPGTLSSDGTTWTSNSDVPLKFTTTYHINATTVDAQGRTTESHESFSTLTPKNFLDAEVRYMKNGDTVGVGMPLALSFNEPITNREAVEERLQVFTTTPVVGAWSWNGDGTRVTFRPKDPWPANSTIKLDANLTGVQANATTYGNTDIAFVFHTGDSLMMKVDAATHMMTVMLNDHPAATYPITTGKPGYETREGIKVISGKEGTVIMDAATTGVSPDSSEYYRLTVEHSMRLTDSGEFIHAAPWSVSSQGNDNVSHGCVGMSTSNAATLYSMARPGDIVIVTNTGRPTTLGNGITVWNESWEQWTAQSATGPHTTTVITSPGIA